MNLEQMQVLVVVLSILGLIQTAALVIGGWVFSWFRGEVRDLRGQVSSMARDLNRLIGACPNCEEGK